MVAQRLVGAFDTPFPLSRFEVSVTASIGVALSHADSTDHAALLAEADLAMYRAKQQGGTTAVVFDDSMRGPLQAGAERPSDAGGAQPEGRLVELVTRHAGLLDDMTDTRPVDLREPPTD
jgi:predicted signal transduction protein with EAL and GGDEF domain